MKAHLKEESKLWSFLVLCQKQIMNARRKSKERNLTWRIQEDNNCWTNFEYFLESISYILYVFSKLRKSGVQRFKRCTIGVETKKLWPFEDNRINLCENFTAAKSATKSTFRCENFTAAKPPASTRVPLRKLKLHLCSCEPCCEITYKLRIKLQIISKLRNHLQVAKSQIQLAKSKFKLSK